MTAEKNSSKFERLFEGVKRSLETEAEYFSKLVEHAPEKGRLNENHIKKILSQYLPRKFGLGTGFVVSSKSFAAREKSPQLDIVIYDALNNTPLYQSDAFGIFPLEMVHGYVEVKTRLTRESLRGAFRANSRVRALKDDKAYSNIDISRQLAPRFYLFAYYCKIPKSKLQTIVAQEYAAVGSAHCHGIYVLEHDMLITRTALGSAKKIGLEVWTRLALPTFLAKISEQAETMIPRGDDERPISFAMPRANLRRYFPPKRVTKTRA